MACSQAAAPEAASLNEPTVPSEECVAADTLANIRRRTPLTAGKNRKKSSRVNHQQVCEWAARVKEACKKPSQIHEIITILAATAQQLGETSITAPDGGFKGLLESMGIRTSPMLQPRFELLTLMLNALKVLKVVYLKLQDTQGKILSQEDQRSLLMLIRAIETIYMKSHLGAPKRFFHPQRTEQLLPGSLVQVVLEHALLCGADFNLHLYDLLVIQDSDNKQMAIEFIKNYWKKTPANDRCLKTIFANLVPMLSPTIICIDGTDDSKDEPKKVITVVITNGRTLVLGAPKDTKIQVVKH